MGIASMAKRARVWVGDIAGKVRLKHISTAVVDVPMTSRTGKDERFYFMFWENSFGKRVIQVNSSSKAMEYRAHEFCDFHRDVAEPWKRGKLTNEELLAKIDQGVEA